MVDARSRDTPGAADLWRPPSRYRTNKATGDLVRIGLTGYGTTVDAIVRQAERAEADGFTSLWYASLVQGDPLVAMAVAGRATSRLELGTAVLQTYPCHPILQANRVASVVSAIDRPGFTLGIGHRTSHSCGRSTGCPMTDQGRTPDRKSVV